MSEPAVEILRPTRGWAGFRLGEVWRYRELLLFFAWRNILIRYKQTVVGIGWAVLQPLLLMVVMTLFFSSYAKQAGVPGLPFYLAGLVPWTFFASSVTQSSASLVGNANLLIQIGLFASIFASNVHRQPWKTILGLNPMAGVVEGFRWALVRSGHGLGPMVAVSCGVAVVLFVSGAAYFRSVERSFADVV